MMSSILAGLEAIMTPDMLLLILAGTFLGLVVGAMPGINGSMAMGILMPLTFTMSPLKGIAMIGAIYCSATYGGCMTAILLGIPGTISSMVTVFDGYPMAQKGLAGRAIGIATISSVIGGLFSAIVLMFFTKPLAEYALLLGPAAYFALAILGLTCIVGLGGKSLAKGLASGILGLLLSTVGIQPQTGAQRFTFNSVNLLQGIPFMPVLIGLFGILAVIKMADSFSTEEKKNTVIPKMSKIWIGFDTCRKLTKTWIRGSLIGTIVGIIPGAGASVATFVSYDVEKKVSKTPELFGTGIEEGIAAPESANNALTGGSLVPLLALGIPGNSSSVFVLTALMVHGIQVGPNFIAENETLSYGFFMTLILVNLIMAPLGLFVAKYMPKILLIPQSLMGGFISAFCILGTYTMTNNIFDPFIALVFGLIGYIMSRADIPTSPMILGLILGGMIESNLQQALVISRGSYNFLYKDTPTLIILLFCLLSLLYPLILKVFRKMGSERREAS